MQRTDKKQAIADKVKLGYSVTTDSNGFTVATCNAGTRPTLQLVNFIEYLTKNKTRVIYTWVKE